MQLEDIWKCYLLITFVVVLNFIEAKLICNAILIFAIQQNDSNTYMCIYIFLIFFSIMV